jgi:hypothetical protein
VAKLERYKREHGDCNVPTKGWAEDSALANWVQHQRAKKKKLDRGVARPRITAARVVQLEALGFAWAPGPGALRGG